MSTLELRSLEKTFDQTQVIHGVDLQVAHGEFVVFVGPSGCGKSTLLRMIAGLDSPTGGDLLIDGQRVNEVGAADRGCAMVFQSYALYPHMTVYANMAFGLENAKVPREEIERKVNEAAKLLRLDTLLQRRPTQLSGGQRQRVAMGRAIVRDPKVFLFDEPLSNLDAKLRVAMRAEIKALHQRLKTTTVYVTHDQIEAMTMADRIVVMHDGIVEQIGTPLELFDRPGNLFVAQFIGSPAMNVFKGTVQNGAVQALGASWPLPTDVRQVADGTAVHYGIRPSDLSLASSGIAAQVVVIEPTGAETELLVQIADQQLVMVIHGRTNVQPGDTVYLQFDAAKAHLFDGHTEQRL